MTQKSLGAIRLTDRTSFKIDFLELKYLLQKYTFYLTFHVTTKHRYIQLPETHPGAGDCGRDVHFGESDL